MLLGLLAAALIALAGCAPPAAPSVVAPATSPEPPRLIALGSDGRAVELRPEPTEGSPPIDRERALRLAADGLAGQSAAAPRISLALLSVPTAEGGALALDHRRVWLVTFPGATFAADACACEGSPTRPSTLVAVDATDGTVLASFGVAG
ncbi:MAG TPA: hypothetical protein VGL23_05330 [Chloroflexota bacterium]